MANVANCSAAHTQQSDAATTVRIRSFCSLYIPLGKSASIFNICFVSSPRDAMLARYILRPCVCLSDTYRRSIEKKRLNELSWVSAWKLPTLCYKEILALPCGTSSQTPGLENLATASRSRCQRSSSSSSTVELVDDTYMTIDESWLFSTSRTNVSV